MSKPSPAALTELKPALECGLIAFGLDAALSKPLLSYLQLLIIWNQAYNLTAIRDPQQMLIKHLLDCLSIAPFIIEHGQLADLGSGAGLPGIVLAIIKPQLQVSLVESNGKKARFLRETVRVLSLSNAQVIEARAEAAGPSGHYDQITARALDRLAGILAVGGHLLKPGGQLLAMKGQRCDDEIAELAAPWYYQAVHRLNVPGLDGERHLIVISDHEQSAEAPVRA